MILCHKISVRLEKRFFGKEVLGKRAICRMVWYAFLTTWPVQQ